MTLIVLDGNIGISVNDLLDDAEAKILEAKKEGVFARFLRTDQEDVPLREVRVDPERVTHLNATDEMAAEPTPEQ